MKFNRNLKPIIQSQDQKRTAAEADGGVGELLPEHEQHLPTGSSLLVSAAEGDRCDSGFITIADDVDTISWRDILAARQELHVDALVAAVRRRRVTASRLEDMGLGMLTLEDMYKQWSPEVLAVRIFAALADELDTIIAIRFGNSRDSLTAARERLSAIGLALNGIEINPKADEKTVRGQAKRLWQIEQGLAAELVRRGLRPPSKGQKKKNKKKAALARAAEANAQDTVHIDMDADAADDSEAGTTLDPKREESELIADAFNPSGAIAGGAVCDTMRFGTNSYNALEGA